MDVSVTMQEDSLLTVSSVEEFYSIKTLLNTVNLDFFLEVGKGN